MISVIIPVYNREKTIRKSIESVLNQTYKDLEIIIVDDGSNDNSKQIIENIQDDRIKYVYQENAGACVARNHGIDISNGKYIAFHDSDDIWLPEKLEKQYDALHRTKADVVICKMTNIGEYGTVIMPQKLNEGFLDKSCSLMNIGTQSIMGKREVFENNKFDIEMPRLQDFELLLRISYKYDIYLIDDALVNYFTGGVSISSNGKKFLNALDLLRKKHPKLFMGKSDTLNDLGKLSLGVANQLIFENNEDFNECMKYAIKYINYPNKMFVCIIYKLKIYGILLKIYYLIKHKKRRLK